MVTPEVGAGRSADLDGCQVPNAVASPAGVVVVAVATSAANEAAMDGRFVSANLDQHLSFLRISSSRMYISALYWWFCTCRPF